LPNDHSPPAAASDPQGGLRGASARPARRALALAFFVSGATSLVLEVAWTKQLGYVLGNTLHAVSTVVAAYLAGLALGAHLGGRRLRGLARPLPVYAGIQLAIGLCGAASIPVLRAAAPLFASVHGALGESPGVFLLARFSVVFALLLVPTTLMGTTLPVIAGAWRGDRDGPAAAGGLVYGLNTLGAVCGTLLAGFVLVPRFGLLATCSGVALVDAVVGAAAWALDRAGIRPPPRPAEAAPAFASLPRGRHDAVAALYLLSGFTAIALEVVWFRYLAYVFGPTADAFALMLGLYLAGIGLGSLVGAGAARRAREPLLALAGLELAVGAIAFATTLGLDRIPDAYMAAYWSLPTGAGDLSSALAQAATAALVVLPATLVLGALFPCAVRAFAELAGPAAPVEYCVGRLYAWNTLGGIAGSLATGFFLLPRLGLWRSLGLAGAASLGIGLACLGLAPQVPRMRRIAWAALPLGFALAIAVLGPRPDPLRLNSGSAFAFLERRIDLAAIRARDAHRSLLFYREGSNASIAVTGNDTGMGHLALWVSGKAEASTELYSRVHLALLGHLPVLFAATPRRVAVVGFGAGITTAAVLASPLVESVDVIEIEPAVIEASRYFALANGDPLADPRARVVIEDGRTHLALAPGPWDVITSDPISPVMAGASSLYTTDFYALAARKLAPGGVFCQWFETWIPSEATYRGMLASIQAVFPHVALFFGTDNTVVLASRDPIRLPFEELRARFGAERVRDGLAAIGVREPAQLLAAFAAGDAALRAFAAGAEHNSDDHNWLERRMASDMRRPEKPPLDPLLYERFRVARLHALREAVPGLPFDELARLAAGPGPLPIGPPRALLWRELRDFFAAEGDEAAIARLRQWRAGARAAGATPGPKRYQALIAEAERAREARDEPAEERSLRELVEATDAPVFYQAGVRLAELLAGQGREAEGLGMARRVQVESPALPQAFAVEVAILRRTRGAAEALAAAERGLLYNPRDPELRRLRDELAAERAR
jgi:spermidine synthase